jgi:hypothetical protein
MDDSGDGATPRRRLGHAGFLAVLAGVPVAALALFQLGHALDPHFPPTVPVPQAAEAELNCFDQPPPGAPQYLPNGFRVVSQLRGSYGGPVGADDEVTWVYNRSCADPTALYPVLVIKVTVSGAELALSDPERRRPVSIAQGANAVYYDGWTTPDARIDSPMQVPVPHWETREANALVVSWSGGTYGILGARTNGIGLGELVAIARKLPLAVSVPCRSCG